MTHAIEFRDVYRHFHDREVLRGLTFTVEPGRICSLLGRNGTCKTTALRILMGFLHPMHGSTRVVGRDSRALTAADRQRIGYVTEGHKMYRDMRVKDVLAFEAGTRPEFNLRYARDAIGRCGLSTNRLVGLLSRGQRAQLSLIMAVADGRS